MKNAREKQNRVTTELEELSHWVIGENFIYLKILLFSNTVLGQVLKIELQSKTVLDLTKLVLQEGRK